MVLMVKVEGNMVKQVAIVALDPRASAFYGNQVQELFGDYVKVRSYSVMEGTISNMVRADLYMMSTDAFDNREEVPQYIPCLLYTSRCV